MADSDFWRKLRIDFEGLQPAQFSLIWSSRLPMSLEGKLLQSQWSWWRVPDQSLTARLSAIALRGAKALGYDSEDAWYDKLRKAKFTEFKLTGNAREKQPDGSVLDSEFGSIDNVVKESITLCHVLEAQDVPYAQACTVEASDNPEWPGDPLFENPFAKTDPNYCAVAPYFEMQNRFSALGEEYPDLSARWRADLGSWQSWPMSHASARSMTRLTPRAEPVPCAPGGDLHLRTVAGEAAERFLIQAGIGSDVEWRMRILARDRWLKADAFEPWELWLHAIREFWLTAREKAVAGGTDAVAFEGIAEPLGYRIGKSIAIGGRVWSLMVTRHEPLSRIIKRRLLEAIGPTEEVAGAIQNGKIAHAFRAGAYFTGVLAADRVRKLEPSARPALTPQRKIGRPREDRNDKIRAAWRDQGSPPVTGEICDKLGKQFFADELRDKKPGSLQHKRVRERVRKTIERTPAT